MSFEIHETSQRNIGATRDPSTNRTTVNVIRSFNLVSTGPSNVIDALAALEAEGVSTGSSHPQNEFYFCDNINVTQVSEIFFEAVATYNSPEGNGDDPVLLPPDITYNTITTNEPTDTAIGGEPIATVTGELYEGISKKISDLGVTIKKNYAIFDPQVFWNYINTVNDDPFLGFPPGVALVDDISATLKTQQDSQYWEVTVKIIIRYPFEVEEDQAWDVRLRHQGYYKFEYLFDKDNPGTPKLDDDGNEILKKERCIDDNEEPVAKPAPLDENGFQQEYDEEPVWLFFTLYERSTFADMNLI